MAEKLVRGLMRELIGKSAGVALAVSAALAGYGIAISSCGEDEKTAQKKTPTPYSCGSVCVDKAQTNEKTLPAFLYVKPENELFADVLPDYGKERINYPAEGDKLLITDHHDDVHEFEFNVNTYAIALANVVADAQKELLTLEYCGCHDETSTLNIYKYCGDEVRQTFAGTLQGMPTLEDVRAVFTPSRKNIGTYDIVYGEILCGEAPDPACEERICSAYDGMISVELGKKEHRYEYFPEVCAYIETEAKLKPIKVNGETCIDPK